MPTADLSTVLDLFERGDTAEAIPLLQHLARLLPTNVTTHVLLARALEAERAWEEALAAWQWAAFLMPNSPIVDRGRRRAIHALATADAPARPASPKPSRGAAAPPEPTEAEADAQAADAQAADTEAGPDPDVTEAHAEPAAADAIDADETPAGPGDLDFLDLADPASPPSPPPATPEPPRVPRPASPTQRGATPSAEARSDLDAYDDLDRLIEELETARIVPQPDLDALPAPELDDDIEDMVSETLARIYAAQGQHDEAARVYELLAAQQPGRADEFRAKADAARSRADR